MKKTLLLFAVMLAVLWGAASADEYPYIYKGLRPMGMGGAFVAVSDDANALFYNPAGLARVEGMHASILPLDVEIGRNAWDMYKDSKDVDFDNEVETAEYLRDHIGDRAHVGLTLFPNFAMPRLAVGLIGTARADLEVHDRQYPQVYTHVISDTGAAVGYAHPLLDDNLSIGATLKYIHRESLVRDYTVLDITSDDLDELIRDDLEKGNGVLMDIGAIYTLSNIGFGNARVGICASNLIGSKLGDAENLDDHIDIGFALDQDVWITKATVAVDYVDLFSQLGQDNDLAKRLRMGVEVRFPLILSLRAGLYQGYYTAGMTLDGTFIRLDALTYAEEIGAYAGQRADRRYDMSLTFGF